MNKFPLSSTRLVFPLRSSHLFFLLVVFVAGLIAQPPPRQIRYTTYSEAQPLMQLMDEILPAELKGKSHDQQAKLWPEWVKSQDAAVRARLRQGDEDTVLNFLLFGTSFTKQPRVSVADLAQLKQVQSSEPISKSFNARLEDFLKGLAAPGANGRLMFSRKLLVQFGHKPGLVEGNAKLRTYLFAGLSRVLNEQDGYRKAIEAARLQGGANEEFVERSRLYRTRGLSLDTTLSPNFAIEESLKALSARGLFIAGSIKKVAIVGPGLDFTDKAAGYDFYPEQTIQPFAVIDSLLRTGLAKAENLQITTFDLSPRVLEHLRTARQKAVRGTGYTVQLPHDPNAKWTSAWLSYWQNFGDQIGKAATPVKASAGIGEMKLRAVNIRPTIVKLITPADLNIVLQRSSQPENFDLIIATNILVYYDVFEQSLALSNIESLLRPGGILLSNNALLELPVMKMKSVGYQTTVYSDRADDGDHLVWYQKK